VRFGTLPLAEAEGAILAHLTEQAVAEDQLIRDLGHDTRAEHRLQPVAGGEAPHTSGGDEVERTPHAGVTNRRGEETGGQRRSTREERNAEVGIEGKRVVRAHVDRDPVRGGVVGDRFEGQHEVRHVLEHVDGEDEVERWQVGWHRLDADGEKRSRRLVQLRIDGDARSVHRLEPDARGFDGGDVVAEFRQERGEGPDSGTDLEDATWMFEFVLDDVEAHVGLVEVDVEASPGLGRVDAGVGCHALGDRIAVESVEEVVEQWRQHRWIIVRTGWTDGAIGDTIRQRGTGGGVDRSGTVGVRMDSADGHIDVSVVVPVYRAAASLGELTERTLAALEGRSVEMVLVNDSSPDDSWQVMSALSAQDPRILSFDLLSNHGQPMATMCGLTQTRGDIVITIDDDLEHPPEEIATLLAALDEPPDWDGAVGYWDQDRTLVRNVGSWIYGTIDRIAWGTPRGFRHSGFRAIRRPAVDAIVSSRTQNPLIGPLLVQLAANVHNVEVRHDKRAHGSSGFKISDGIRMARNHLRYGSILPLQMLSRFGSLVARLSLLFGAYLLLRAVAGQPGPQGWMSTFVAVLFFGGSILFGIGMLGQYIGTIIAEVRRPPRFSVRRALPEGTSVRSS